MNLKNIDFKKVLRVLSASLTLICFMPTFLVSCSGQEKAYSVISLAEEAGNNYPLVNMFIIIPVAILIITFIKSIKDKSIGIIALILSILNIINWSTITNEFKKAAASYFCEVRVTGWYYLNFLLIFGVILCSIFLIDESKTGIINIFKQPTGEANNQSLNNCPNCGMKIPVGFDHCVHCGFKLNDINDSK